MYQAIPGSFCAIKLLHKRDRQKLTLSFVIIQIRTMGRGLQKNGQRAFAWVFGSLWWLDQEREQHGEPFVSVWLILVKFSIFYWPQWQVNSNNGDRRQRYFSFSYIFGDFSGMVFFFYEFFSELQGLRVKHLNFCILLSRKGAWFLSLKGISKQKLSFFKETYENSTILYRPVRGFSHSLTFILLFLVSK